MRDVHARGLARVSSAFLYLTFFSVEDMEGSFLVVGVGAGVVYETVLCHQGPAFRGPPYLGGTTYRSYPLVCSGGRVGMRACVCVVLGEACVRGVRVWGGVCVRERGEGKDTWFQ